MLFESILERIIIAAFYCLLGFILGRAGGRFLFVILHEAEVDKRLRISSSRWSLEKSSASFFKWCVYFATILLILNSFGLAVYAVLILILVSISVLVFSVFFSLRNIVPNILAGLKIFRDHSFPVGSKVVFGKTKGIIAKLDLLEAKVRTVDGDLLIVPNYYLLKNAKMSRVVRQH